MLGQIENAKAKNTRIKKVVLVGGFGDSPALKEHLQASLTALNNKSQTPVMLVVAPPSKSATGVAIGAVKRAHDKINGPMRIPNRSIGVRRHIPWDADAYSEEVLKQRCTLTEISQEEYIMDTILWVIKAVRTTAFLHSIATDDATELRRAQGHSRIRVRLRVPVQSGRLEVDCRRGALRVGYLRGGLLR
jgi:hypothetical protein